MENQNTSNMARPLFKDPRVMAIVDEMMQKIRDILDQFEGIIHEIWNIAQMVADMVEHIRRLFRGNRVEPAMAEVPTGVPGH